MKGVRSHVTVDFNSLWPRGFGNILGIWELRSRIRSFIVGIACAEGSESDDLKSWLSTFKHQLDSETFTCIYEKLKANQFCNRLKIKLTREEEFNLIFNKQLPLGAKALLQYQISLLREQSPLQKPTASRVREEKEDTSAKNTKKGRFNLLVERNNRTTLLATNRVKMFIVQQKNFG